MSLLNRRKAKEVPALPTGLPASRYDPRTLPLSLDRNMPEPRADWPVEQFNAPAVQLARGTLVELLGGGLHETSGAEIYGEYGIGKSQFLLGLAKRTFQDVRVETGAAGVAVLKGDATLTETSDLAMGVIKAFFHPPANYDPTPADERKALRDVKAVVLLDEWRVGDDEIGALRAMAPGLRVVAANEKSKLAILKSQLLPGLDLDDAVQLLRDALGPAAAARISDDEAKQLCDAADGNPHRIKLAGLALRNAPVAALLQRVEGRKSGGSKYPVESAVLEDLGPEDLKILAVLRFFERAPVDTATIRAVAGLGEDADERVERLRDEKWVRSHSPYYSLAVPSAVVPYDEVQHAAFADAALRHLAGWAREERLNPQVVLPQLAAAWHVLDVSSEAEPRQILDLAFGIEHALAFDGRWTAWERVVKRMIAAATAIGDDHAAAYGWYQLGVRARAHGDRERGTLFLEASLRLARRAGDGLLAALAHAQLAPRTAARRFAASIEDLSQRAEQALLVASGAAAGHALYTERRTARSTRLAAALGLAAAVAHRVRKLAATRAGRPPDEVEADAKSEEREELRTP